MAICTNHKASNNQVGTIGTLLIEDNLAYRTAFKNLLASRFHQIVFHECATGKEALRLLQDFCPDLIFLDLKLPDQSGLKLIKKIKKLHPHACLIILTACDSQEYRHTALAYGATHFMAKGSTTSTDMLARVEGILAGLVPEKLIDS